ncbi:MAG: hypothetical protein HYS22_08375 [Deltaproteobacteria bacterium]|nr:hypothetical protein [Deltaproteobacteria bacterium]
MNLSGIDPNRLKFESKVHDASPPPPRKGFFGSLIRGLGAIASPVGFAAAPFFPPAAIAGFGGAGLYTMGSMAQQRRVEKQYLQNNPPQPMAPQFPGFSGGAAPASYTGVSYLARPVSTGGVVGSGGPAAGGIDTEAMSVLNLKQDTMNVMAQHPEGMIR